MIDEVAFITVKPGMAEAFERGAREAVSLFRRAEGCHGMRVERVIEAPDQYRLVVRWESVAHHTETFRPSPDFARWRELVAHTFEQPPRVDHMEVAFVGF